MQSSYFDLVEHKIDFLEMSIRSQKKIVMIQWSLLVFNLLFVVSEIFTFYKTGQGVFALGAFASNLVWTYAQLGSMRSDLKTDKVILSRFQDFANRKEYQDALELLETSKNNYEEYIKTMEQEKASSNDN